MNALSVAMKKIQVIINQMEDLKFHCLVGSELITGQEKEVPPAATCGMTVCSRQATGQPDLYLHNP
jgi:hypothetical protein